MIASCVSLNISQFSCGFFTELLSLYDSLCVRKFTVSPQYSCFARILRTTYPLQLNGWVNSFCFSLFQFLFCKVNSRGFNLVIKQRAGYVIRSAAFYCEMENSADDCSRFLINQPMIFVVRVFLVTVNSRVGCRLSRFVQIVCNIKSILCPSVSVATGLTVMLQKQIHI